MREGQRQLIDWQGRYRTSLAHQRRFRQSARYDLDRLIQTSDLPTKQRALAIKRDFDRPATYLGLIY